MGALDREAMERVVERLHAQEPTFDWVGVYILEGDALVLGPFRGNPTEHIRIPLGQGVCGSVAASDAFFPFRDGLDVVAQAGARAVIQPGGSVRDAEVIAAANEHGMAMVFTGMRHFRH